MVGHDREREVFTSNRGVRNFKSTLAMICPKSETRVPLRAGGVRST